MRRFNLLLTSLGVLSFAATLGILHVTRGPLFGHSRPQAIAAIVPAAQKRDSNEPAPQSAAIPAPAAAALPTSSAPIAAQPSYSAPIALPEPARAELVTLRTTLENQGDVRDRLVAVNSLRVIGMGGDADGYIRASLRAAMNDPNPNVKSNAELAYDMVAAQYGNAP